MRALALQLKENHIPKFSLTSLYPNALWYLPTYNLVPLGSRLGFFMLQTVSLASFSYNLLQGCMVNQMPADRKFHMCNILTCYPVFPTVQLLWFQVLISQAGSHSNWRYSAIITWWISQKNNPILSVHTMTEWFKEPITNNTSYCLK